MSVGRRKTEAYRLQGLDGGIACFHSTVLYVLKVQFVVFPGDIPQVAVDFHEHVNYTTGPDVYRAPIELRRGILFRGYVGPRAPNAGKHTGLVIFGRAHSPAAAKVADLQAASGCEEQVVGLQVAVRDADAVEVLDAARQLLEEAVGLGAVQRARGFEERGESAELAVLHHREKGLLVLQQVQRSDYVCVSEILGQGELGQDSSAIPRMALVALSMELFDSKEGVSLAVGGTLVVSPDGAVCPFADHLPALAVFLC